MWLEGYCFAAGMGAVLVFLPIMGIWSGCRQDGRKISMDHGNKKVWFRLKERSFQLLNPNLPKQIRGEEMKKYNMLTDSPGRSLLWVKMHWRQ